MYNCCAFSAQFSIILLMDADAIVRTYFAKLSLDPEIADIYLALHTNGPQSISALARTSGVERTKVYRLLDGLLASGLVEVEAHDKRDVIKAAPIANIRILIAQREQELKSLRDDLDMLEHTLARNSLSNPAMHVQTYHGIEGLRQMQWNQLRTTGELLSIVNEPLQHALGKQFVIRWSEAANANNLQLRQITTPHFNTLDQQWHRRHRTAKLIAPERITRRTITPAAFPVEFNTDIWNDTVAYYNWKDGEIYGIELHNAAIADAQRHYFAMAWDRASQAKP